jgi:LysM repeat protein
MQPKTRRFLLTVIIVLIWAAVIPASAADQQSGNDVPAISAAEIIAEINAYRTANGLGTLSYNATLASLAQAHSEFMANTGSITHTEGGTSPTDRAYAVGYGDGHKIIMSEIIFGGWDADVNDAITWWKNSTVHNNVMLDSRYLEIGAGVATDGTINYYTAEIAWVTPYAAPSGSTPDDSSGDTDSGEDDIPEEVIVYSPVVVATPAEDGSITHIVESGQTLWTIAAVYQVDLQTVLDLNEMSSGTWVFPGDEILVRPPGDYPTAAPEETGEAGTLEPSDEAVIGDALSAAPGQAATPLPTAGMEQTTNSTPTLLPTLEPPKEAIIEDPVARWMVVLAFVIIFGVVVGSFFFQKPKKRPPPDSY